MLEKIVIKNICSIKECTLDFKKGNYQYEKENILEEVVNPVALYGHNGSGKSSFLRSIKQFISLMINPVERLVPFEVNNLLLEKYINEKDKNEEYITGSIQFSFTLKQEEFKGKLFNYQLSVSQINGILEENLFANNITIFTRGKKSFVYKNKEKDISKNSPFVSTLRSLASTEVNDSLIQVVYAYLSSFAFVDLQYINAGGFIISKDFSTSTNIYDLIVEKSDEIKQELKNYKDFPYYVVRKNKQARTIKNLTSDYYLEIEDENDRIITLPFELISSGMRNNSILLSIVLSMPEESVLFVDELEMALHPSAIQSLLHIVRKKKIQLVFSSHNTNILQYLRPDQVYFARWKNGFSTLLRLSNIYPNIREINNIEKMYLSSVFDEVIKTNGE